MTKSSKIRKITRETQRAREALQAGKDPVAVGLCAYTRGWDSAYEQSADECIGKRSGWIARFERGIRDRLAHDTRANA